MTRFICILLLVLLNGCASQVESLVADLGSAGVCCTKIEEMTFAEFPSNDEERLTIGPGDSVYEFESGRSFFKAFRLPSGREGDSLEITTFLVGGWIPNAHVFVPVLQFIDEQHSRLGSAIELDLDFEETFSDLFWRGSIAIPHSASFMIVYSRADEYFQKIELDPPHSSMVPTQGGLIFLSSSEPRYSTKGPAGKLRFNLVSTAE